VDLWGVAGTISTESVYPVGVDPNVSLTTINGQLIPHHTAQVRNFVRSIRGSGEPAITGRDATKALRILLAVYESSRTGHSVRFAPMSESTRPVAQIAG
jgi:predicted dehydrogenase